MTKSMTSNNQTSNEDKSVPKIHVHTSGEIGIFANAYPDIPKAQAAE